MKKVQNHSQKLWVRKVGLANVPRFWYTSFSDVAFKRDFVVDFMISLFEIFSSFFFSFVRFASSKKHIIWFLLLLWMNYFRREEKGQEEEEEGKKSHSIERKLTIIGSWWRHFVINWIRISYTSESMEPLECDTWSYVVCMTIAEKMTPSRCEMLVTDFHVYFLSAHRKTQQEAYFSFHFFFFLIATLGFAIVKPSTHTVALFWLPSTHMPSCHCTDQISFGCIVVKRIKVSSLTFLR